MTKSKEIAQKERGQGPLRTSSGVLFHAALTRDRVVEGKPESEGVRKRAREYSTTPCIDRASNIT